MTREDFAQIVHWQKIIWTFGFLNVAALSPQLLKLFQTRETAGLSIWMFILFLFIQIAFSLEGFFRRNSVLLICMSLSAAETFAIILRIVYLRNIVS